MATYNYFPHLQDLEGPGSAHNHLLCTGSANFPVVSAMRVTIGCRVRLKGLPGHEGKIGTVLNSFRGGFTIELDGSGRVFAETRHLKVWLHRWKLCGILVLLPPLVTFALAGIQHGDRGCYRGAEGSTCERG